MPPWTCPSCGTIWLDRPDGDDVSGCPECGRTPASLSGAASPLCARCGGEHLAADCPNLTAGGEIDPDAEGTR